MKTLKHIIFSFFIVSLFFSCEKETKDFDGREQVYFQFARHDGESRSIMDSTFVKFGYDIVQKTDSTIRVAVTIVGAISESPRAVNFILVDSLSTAKLGEDIELMYETSYIAENSINGYVYVKLKNTDKIKDASLLATIQVAENEFFSADIDLIVSTAESKQHMKANRYRIFFDAQSEMPNLWAVEEARFRSYLGVYSRVKLEFMCEILGLDYAYFTYDPGEENSLDVFNRRIVPFRMVWTSILNRGLNEYRAKHGYPLRDENGLEIAFGLPASSLS